MSEFVYLIPKADRGSVIAKGSRAIRKGGSKVLGYAEGKAKNFELWAINKTSGVRTKANARRSVDTETQKAVEETRKNKLRAELELYAAKQGAVDKVKLRQNVRKQGGRNSLNVATNTAVQLERNGLKKALKSFKDASAKELQAQQAYDAAYNEALKKTFRNRAKWGAGLTITGLPIGIGLYNYNSPESSESTDDVTSTGQPMGYQRTNNGWTYDGNTVQSGDMGYDRNGLLNYYNGSDWVQEGNYRQMGDGSIIDKTTGLVIQGPSSQGNYFDNNMRALGLNSRDQVKELQRQLIANGLLKEGEDDGYMGRRTMAAYYAGMNNTPYVSFNNYQ